MERDNEELVVVDVANDSTAPSVPLISEEEVAELERKALLMPSDLGPDEDRITCGELLKLIATFYALKHDILTIQQNANDNYAASENRLHNCEAEREKFRKLLNDALRELAKDDERMGSVRSEKEAK